MTDQLDKFEFLSEINKVADIYSKSLSSGMLGSYFDSLKKFELSDIKLALVKLMIESQYMPKPFDIAQAVQKIVDDRRVTENKINPSPEKKVSNDEYFSWLQKHFRIDGRKMYEDGEKKRKELNMSTQEYGLHVFGRKSICSELSKIAEQQLENK